MADAYVGMATLSTFSDGDWAWFIGYYFTVIVVGKVWLNGYLCGLDRKGYTALLVVAFAVVQFSWSAGLLAGFSGGLSLLVNGLFLYALGGYIRHYDCFGHIRVGALVLLLAALCAIMFLSYRNVVNQAIENYWRAEAAQPGQTFYQPVEEYGNSSLCVIVAAVCLFELFRRIEMPSVRVVNFLGASTFMVYFIHDNGFFYSLWDRTDWVSLLYYDRYAFVPELLRQALLTFVAGVAAYALYLALAALWRRAKPVFLKPGESDSEEP